tara:strand:+ start:1784 stop:2044 length:261 start_codon:yes stop_codon:yes gene_type:complete
MYILKDKNIKTKGNNMVKEDELGYNKDITAEVMVAKVETAIIELEKVYAFLGYKVEAPYDDIPVLSQLQGLLYELTESENNLYDPK